MMNEVIVRGIEQEYKAYWNGEVWPCAWCGVKLGNALTAENIHIPFEIHSNTAHNPNCGAVYKIERPTHQSKIEDTALPEPPKLSEPVLEGVQIEPKRKKRKSKKSHNKSSLDREQESKRVVD